MSHSPALPTLDFYTRDGCELCAEARLELQDALEQRVRRGDPIARVREVDLARQPEFEERYGALIPVLALKGSELTLAMGGRTIALFLDRVLGRLA
jgi:glutaredoxin-like protein DUF836